MKCARPAILTLMTAGAPPRSAPLRVTPRRSAPLRGAPRCSMRLRVAPYGYVAAPHNFAAPTREKCRTKILRQKE